MFDGSKIVGAILFFHQGTFVSNGTKVNAVNMSCWFVKEIYRGISTISFARFMLQELEDCVITNYSANDAASKILCLLGFRYMKLERFSNRLHSSLGGIFSGMARIKNLNTFDHDFGQEFDFMPSGALHHYSISYKSSSLRMLVKSSYIKRKILGMDINMKAQIVIWTSDYGLLSKFWEKYTLALMFATKSLKVIADIPDVPKPDVKYSSKNNYLIFGPEDIDVIEPINSEMNIF